MSKAGTAVLVLVFSAGAFALGHYAASSSRPSAGRFAIDASPRYEIPRPDGPESSWDEILEVLSEPASFDRVKRLADLLSRLGPGAGLQASAALESRTVDLAGPEIELLLRAWAADDPHAAATWSAYDSPLAYRMSAVVVGIQTLAMTDSRAAIDIVQALGLIGSEVAEAAETALIRGWFLGGAEGLEEYIKYLGLGYSQQRALAELSRQLIKRDGGEAAMAWAEGFKEGEEPRIQRAVNRQLGSELAKLDIPYAVEWCIRVCDDDLGRDVMALIAQRWAAQDGPSAMEWLSAAPAGRQRDLGVKGAFRGWWRQDPAGFRNWADAQMKDGVPPYLAPLMENYSAALGRRVPLEGIELAMRIEDEKTRERALAAIVVAWAKKDVDAANAWLDDSPLSEAARQRILQAVPAIAVPDPADAEAEAPADGEGAGAAAEGDEAGAAAP